MGTASVILAYLLSEIKILNIFQRNFTQRYKFLIEAKAVSKLAILNAVKVGGFTQSTRVELNKVYRFNIQNRIYEVILSAEDGRYPLNPKFAKSHELERLFNVIGLDMSHFLADSILDFQDSDNLVRLNGAERDEYINLGYAPPNRPLKSLSELIWVKGINLTAYRKIKEYTTVYTQRINLNYASTEVLYALGFTKEQINRILKMRKRSFLKPTEIKSIVGKRWTFLINRISLYPLPSVYRAYVREELSGEEVELILMPNGKIIDILWF